MNWGLATAAAVFLWPAVAMAGPVPTPVVTITSLAVTPADSAVFGTPVTLTATVRSIGPGLEGVVEFFDGTTLIGGGPLVESNAVTGTVSLTTSALAPGSHSFVATYPFTNGACGFACLPSSSATPPEGALAYEITVPVPVPTIAGWAEMGLIGALLALGTALLARNGRPQ